MNPYYRFDIASNGQSQCFLIWPKLLTDPQAVNAAVRAYRIHQLARAERLKVMQQTQQVLKNLACALDNPDCRRP